MGTIVLFTSSDPCAACGGTGRSNDLAKILGAGNTAAGSDIVLDGPLGSGNTAGGEIHFGDPPGQTRGASGVGGVLNFSGGTGSSGGNVVITGGNATATSGVAGCITLTTGSTTGTAFTTTNTTASSTTLNLNQSAMTLSAGGGPAVDMLTGTRDPREAGIQTSLGSLYMRDDGESGSLWVKTHGGPDGWCQLSTTDATTSTTEANSDVDRAVQSVLDAPDNPPILEWSIRKIAEMEKAAEEWRAANDDQNAVFTHSGVMDNWIPCVAPVSTAILADMMAILEQEGHEVEAFISSARDFADIRKFASGDAVVWEGKRVTLFGVPILQSHKIPAGYMAAVSTERLMCLTTVTR